MLRYCSGLNLSRPAGRVLRCGAYGVEARRLASANSVSKLNAYATGFAAGAALVRDEAKAVDIVASASVSASAEYERFIEPGKRLPHDTSRKTQYLDETPGALSTAAWPAGSLL